MTNNMTDQEPLDYTNELDLQLADLGAPDVTYKVPSDFVMVHSSFELLLGQIAMLDSIPLDALDQFIEMLQKNFPTSLDNVSGL